MFGIRLFNKIELSDKQYTINRVLTSGVIMKESRLFQLLYYILEKGRVTAPELADKFEVSVRTIYRDIDWISSAGIPIYTTRGKGGGIEIDSNFIINKAMLSPDEKEQIMIALNNTKNINELEQSDLIKKLSVLFDMKNSNWIEVDSTNWKNSDIYEKLFEDIKFAIIHKKFISFDYYSNKLEYSKRKIKPIRLVFKSWSWYVYGFCNLRNDFRFFKLSRMKNHLVHDEIYEDDYSNIVIDKKIQYENLVHVKLKFNKSQANRVYDEFSDIVIEKDNYLFVELDLPKEYLYSYVLSFASEVEVLEPKEIRVELKNIVDKIIKKY